MRPLANKTNVAPPDDDYPFGRIKDNPGNNTGTPINEEVYGDFHQFFEKLMAEGLVTPNDLPDNDYSGFQLYEAFEKAARKANRYDSRQFIIDAGGTAITTGFKGDLEIPFDCKIIGVRLYGRGAGSITIDIWKTNAGGFPSSAANSITAAAKPELAGGAQFYEDLVLTGWAVDCVRGENWGINVDAAATKERVTLVLLLDRFV